MWIEKTKNGKFKFVERYEEPLTGKTKRVSITHTKNTKKIREEMLLMLNLKIEEQLNHRDKSAITLGQALDKWAEIYKRSVKPSTYQTTTQYITSIKNELGDILVSQLTAPIINSFFENCLIEKNLSRAVVTYRKSVIIRVLKYAANNLSIDKTDIIPHFTIPNINISKRNHNKYLEPNELAKVLSVLEARSDYYNLAYILVHTGMRYGELVALDYQKDIDFTDNSISINKTYYNITKTYSTPKTGDSRTIYFSNDLAHVLNKQIMSAKLMKLKHNFSRDNYLLFPTVHGNPIDINNFNFYIGQIELTDKKITSHYFRHTFITMAVQNGMSKELIAKQVGHTSQQMIDNIYSHFTKEMSNQQKEAMRNFKIV